MKETILICKEDFYFDMPKEVQIGIEIERLLEERADEVPVKKGITKSATNATPNTKNPRDIS